MKNLANMERSEKFATIATIKNNFKILHECYKNTADGTPTDTINKLIDRIGKTATIETVAELVNGVSSWDGRVYDTVRSWAANIENAASFDELRKYGIYSDIHSAHINQIGQAMKDYK